MKTAMVGIRKNTICPKWLQPISVPFKMTIRKTERTANRHLHTRAASSLSGCADEAAAEAGAPAVALSAESFSDALSDALESFSDALSDALESFSDALPDALDVLIQGPR